MSIPRTPSITNLEKLCLEVDAMNHLPPIEDTANDFKGEALKQSSIRLDKFVEGSIAFSQAFQNALKNHSEEDLRNHLLTILPRGHSIPCFF